MCNGVVFIIAAMFMLQFRSLVVCRYLDSLGLLAAGFCLSVSE